MPPPPPPVPSVSWKPSSMERLLFPGEQTHETITFQSTVALSNVTISVDSTLQGYVSVTPPAIASVPANKDITLTLVISVPSGATTGIVATGNIAVANGSTKQLSLTMEIEAAASKSPLDSDIFADADGSFYPVNQLVVELASGLSLSDAENLAASVGGQVVGCMPSTNSYQFELPSKSVADLVSIESSLLSNPSVLGLFRNYLVGSLSTDLDALANRDARLTHAYDLASIRDAWTSLTAQIPLKDVTIGIIDSGIDRSHPEFSGVDTGQWVPLLSPTDTANSCNPYGHGTSVAGIIGANNLWGAGGPNEMNGFLSGLLGFQDQYHLTVRGATLVFSKLPIFDLLLRFDVLGQSQVINISYGGTRCSAIPPAQMNSCSGCVSDSDFGSISNVFLQGVRSKPNILFVIAAGNSGIDVKDEIPANVAVDPRTSNVIVVGASSVFVNPGEAPDDQRAVFNTQTGAASNWGNAITIAAPGMHVYAPFITTANPTSYGPYWDPIGSIQAAGTSVSAPIVTGAAGILKAIEGATSLKKLSPAQIKSILVSSGDDITVDKPIGTCSQNEDGSYQCKRLNVLQAVEQVLTRPAWMLTGNMAQPSRDNTATRLKNGKVLITAGTAGALAELYDPNTATFSPAGTMVFNPGQGSTAALLADGRVLIVSGYSAEIYDPLSGTFTTTGSLVAPHYYHTATLLPDGTVLIAAGQDENTVVTHAIAEVYNPTTGAFTLTGNLNQDRSSHTATLLPNGKVLVAGGIHTTTPGSGAFLISTELYDPALGAFVLGPDMLSYQDQAVLLMTGKVLMVGGNGALAELYDSSVNSFAPTGNMVVGRFDEKAVLLPSGRVLVVGGINIVTLNAAELYDPDTGTFTATADMLVPRQEHTVTLLSNNQVLVAGGYELQTSQDLSSAELFSGVW